MEFKEDFRGLKTNMRKYSLSVKQIQGRFDNHQDILLKFQFVFMVMIIVQYYVFNVT